MLRGANSSANMSETSTHARSLGMSIQDLWDLQDTTLLSLLVPPFAYSPGDHYANPWVLGKVRLMLVFPFLSDDERETIQKARLALEELRILTQREESYVTPDEREEFEGLQVSVWAEYDASMQAVGELTKSGRLTEAQVELLGRELRAPNIHPEPGAAVPRAVLDGAAA
jgi:hypothetical protein